MCLEISIFSRKRIAKKDIVCYKYLYQEQNELYTPFQHCLVKIGETYFSDIERRFLNRNIQKGLHSLVNLQDIIVETFGNNLIIVQCIIPKGSIYYKGKWSGIDSYVSNFLKYIEIIK